jgi:hypothetical protein
LSEQARERGQEQAGPQEGSRGGSWAVYGSTCLVIVAAMVVVVGLWSRRAAPACEGPPGCVEGWWVELPALTVRYGDPEPRLVVALFVDLESAASRQVFSEVTGVIGIGGLGVRSSMWLLHAPDGGCVGASASARGCVAARAVECAEAAAKGRGVEMAGLLFDAQWPGAAEERGEESSLKAQIQRAAATIGVEDREVFFDQCVEADQAVAARVAAQSAWARERGLVAAPAGFVMVASRLAVFDERLNEASLRRVIRCLVDEGDACERSRS